VCLHLLLVGHLVNEDGHRQERHKGRCVFCVVCAILEVEVVIDWTYVFCFCVFDL
jgi:hypothetical protein